MTKKTVTISYEQARELLQRAVQERGEDFEYGPARRCSDCVYFGENSQPSCIVGHVLSYMGVTRDDLDGYPEPGSWHAIDLNYENAVCDLVEQGVIKADQRTQDLLASAQTLQDEGAPWGRAVRESLCKTGLVDA